MIINHNGAGPVRVRILKRSGARHRNQYYDEWRLIGDNSRSPEFYIPVEDGDLYAIEITYLQGFDMRPFSHARSSFRQIGHRGAVKMETYHHLRNPEYRAGAEQRLTRDIVHTIYKKAEGKINGANMRDLEFALKELMPDPELTERHGYGYGASAEDLSRISIEVFCFKETREDISEEEAWRRWETNRGRHDREVQFFPQADEWIPHDTVDPKNHAKGVTHTHTYVNGTRIHRTPRVRTPGHGPLRPLSLFRTHIDSIPNPRTIFPFRFTSLKQLTNGDYVKVNSLKTEDLNVKPEEDEDVDEEEDVKLTLKMEGKNRPFKRSDSHDDDIKFRYIKSKKFEGKCFPKEKWMPAGKKRKMSPSPKQESQEPIKRSESQIQDDLKLLRSKRLKRFAGNPLRKGNSMVAVKKQKMMSSSPRLSRVSEWRPTSKDDPIILNSDDEDDEVRVISSPMSGRNHQSISFSSPHVDLTEDGDDDEDEDDYSATPRPLPENEDSIPLNRKRRR